MRAGKQVARHLVPIGTSVGQHGHSLCSQSGVPATSRHTADAQRVAAAAANLQGPLRDVRRALLEADVSLPVVRRFIKKVEERALGLEVSPCLHVNWPSQVVS